MADDADFNSRGSREIKAATFRQILLFEAAGRLGNATHAARILEISQPAAAQSLASFETRVGLDLVRGRGKGSSLTAAGRALHGRVTRIVERLRLGLGQVGVAEPDLVIRNLHQAHLRLLDGAFALGSLENAALAQGHAARMALRILRQLETWIGIDLLMREGGQYRLNGAGIALARQIGLLADEFLQSVSEVRLREAQTATVITIGVAPDPGTASLDRIVVEHLSQAEEGCIEIVESAQNDLETQLLIGRIDLLVGYHFGAASPDLDWETLSRTHYLVVAREGHPLLDLPNVGLAEMARYPWLLGAEGSRRRLVSDLLFEGRRHPDALLISSAPPMMARVLAATDALALMTPDELALRGKGLGKVQHAVPQVDVTIGMAARRGWQPSRGHERIREALRRRFGIDLAGASPS